MSSYKAMVPWRNGKIESLKDIISDDLCVLFVGMNPAPDSVEAGHYHQGQLGQRFWKRLERCKIVPKPQDSGYHDDLLLERKLGITDLVKVPSKAANQVRASDIHHGRKVLQAKLVQKKPRIVCFIYKEPAEKFYETKFTNRCGFLSEPEAYPAVFVLSSPYGSKSHGEAYMRKLVGLMKERCD